jgi:hypothetical protein
VSRARIHPRLARPGPKKLAPAVRRILVALGAYGRVGASPKMLAATTRVPYRTVKRHLTFLVSNGTIQAPYRGQYLYVPGTPDILADPGGMAGIHGLVLSCPNWQKTLLRGSFGPFLALGPDPRPGTQYDEKTRAWRGRMVRFRLYPTGTMVVYVAASRLPIPWGGEGGFAEFVGWLGGTFDPVDVGRAFNVVEIGVHLDYEGWSLKGVQAVELRHFGGAIEQLYQKVSATRHEVHLHPKELLLRDAVRIISEGSPTAQMERVLRSSVRLVEREERLKDEQAKKEKPAPPIRPDSQSGYG